MKPIRPPSSFLQLSRVLLHLLVNLPAHVSASPEPKALALAEPEAQTYNYAPFSGAIYIVGGNGLQFSSASPAQCPANAPQGCGNINIWNWCCPAGSTCQMLSNSIVGCCQQGATCGGNVQPTQIQTLTVTTTVAAQQQQTQSVPTVVQVAGTTTTLPPANGGGGVFVTSIGSLTKTMIEGTFCQTVFMQGNPVPTTAKGACGTVLILNDGERVGVGVGWVVLGCHLLFAVGAGLRFWRL